MNLIEKHRREELSTMGPLFWLLKRARLLVLLLTAPLMAAVPGELLWKTNVGLSISTPAIASGRVYSGTLEMLRGIDAASGQELWRTNIFVGHAAVAYDAVQTAEGTVEETVYVSSFMDGVQAFDARSGANRWKISATSDAAPAISRMGVIYVSTDTGMTALRKTDGSVVWSWPKPSESDILFAPAIGQDETIYFGSINKIVYALDGRTGAFRWSFQTGHFVVASPAIGEDGTVYIGSYDHKLYALNGVSGEKLWEFETGDRVTGTVAIGPNGDVYTGSADGKMYALDGRTGAKKWEFVTGGGVSSSPALTTDGSLYFGSNDSRLYALNAATGSKIWEFVAAGEIDTAPNIGPDGTIYFVSRDMFLYAVAGATPLAASPWPSYRFDAAQSGRGRASDRPILKGPTFAAGNPFGFAIFNPTAKPVAVQSSTNLLDWTEQIVFTRNDLQFNFTDPGPNTPRKFYRLLNP